MRTTVLIIGGVVFAAAAMAYKCESSGSLPVEENPTSVDVSAAYFDGANWDSPALTLTIDGVEVTYHLEAR